MSDTRSAYYLLLPFPFSSCSFPSLLYLNIALKRFLQKVCYIDYSSNRRSDLWHSSAVSPTLDWWLRQDSSRCACNSWGLQVQAHYAISAPYQPDWQLSRYCVDGDVGYGSNWCACSGSDHYQGFVHHFHPWARSYIAFQLEEIIVQHEVISFCKFFFLLEDNWWTMLDIW